MNKTNGIIGKWFSLSPSIKARALFLILAILAGFGVQGAIVLYSAQKHMEFVTYMQAEDWRGRVALDRLDETVTELERQTIDSVTGAPLQPETLPAITSLADQVVEQWTMAELILGNSMDSSVMEPAGKSVRDLPRLSEALKNSRTAGPATANSATALITAVQNIRIAKTAMGQELESVTAKYIGREKSWNQDVSLYTAIISGVGFVLLAIVMGALLFRMVARLNLLTNVIQRLANNELDMKIPMQGKKDEMGKLARSLEVVRENAVHRQHADQALHEERESFKAIVTTIRDGIVAIDSNSVIRMFNQAAQDIFGYTEEEVIGQYVTVLVPEAMRDRHDGYVRNADRHAPRIIDRGRDLIGRRKDGTMFPMELTVSPADLRGERVFIAVCRDISERKEAEQELRDKTSTLELLYQISAKTNHAATGSEALASSVRDICLHTGWPVGHIYMRDEEQNDRLHSSRIWYLEDTRKTAEFKSATEDMIFGWAEGLPGRVLASAKPEWIEDLAGDPRFGRAETAEASGIVSGFAVPVMARKEVIAVLEFFSWERKEADPILLEALTNLGSQLGRVVERRRAGKALKEKERALGEHVKRLSETQDQLTEQSRQLAEHRDELEEKVVQRTGELEQALEKEQGFNALQRKFVAMASHEFRTPLTIIDGEMRRIMKRSETIKPEEIAERGNSVRGAVKRMTGLIDSTLSLSRMDAGNIVLDLKECYLQDLVVEVSGRQQGIAPHHEIAVNVDELPKEITADAQLLDQVFTNLLSNAVKYSGSDPRVEVTGWTEAEDAVISVRDHGVGIPAGEMPQMFQRFFRATTSEGVSGTGIGLTVVKQFIERHGGSASVESIEGEGSTFTVRLPIAGPASDEHEMQDSVASVGDA